jgi:hypothetical protein
VPFRDPARARFSSRKTHGHYTCSFLPSPSLKSTSSLTAQTSRSDPPTKHPLKYPASHNSQEARQPKTSRTINSNAQDSNARNENKGSQLPGLVTPRAHNFLLILAVIATRRDRTPGTRTPKNKGQEQNAQQQNTQKQESRNEKQNA